MNKNAILIILIFIILMGCFKNDKKKNEVEVKFSYKLSAVLQKKIQKSKKRAPHSIKGQMIVTNIENSETVTKDWYVVIDENEFTAISSSTIILTPSAYDFTLTIIDNNYKYTGNITNKNIIDGITNLNMTLKPIIGNINSNTNLTQFSNLKLKYNISELSNISNPTIGVSVNSEDETIFSINKNTGMSDYLVLTPGSYNLDLKFNTETIK